jgi:hypothetical protein
MPSKDGSGRKYVTVRGYKQRAYQVVAEMQKLLGGCQVIFHPFVYELLSVQTKSTTGREFIFLISYWYYWYWHC